MESDTDSAGEDHAPPLPAKHYQLFRMDSNKGCVPKEMFEGKMGPLPLFIAVNVGYDPEDQDPFMYPYESEEILFAYKLDCQERVLLVDGKQQTWSLPLCSPLLFTSDKAKDVTLSDLLDIESLPAAVNFSRPETLKFEVRNPAAATPYLAAGLKLTKVYYEQYYWCLSLSLSGLVRDKPVALPRNLHEVCFSRISSIVGAVNPQEKVQEYVERYSRIAQEKNFQGDPFFQDLALVCRGPQPVNNVEPYIDQDTFVTIRHLPRHEVPLPTPLPVGKAPPTLPPRPKGVGTNGIDESGRRQSPSPERDAESTDNTYHGLEFSEDDIHVYGDGPVYHAPRDLGIPVSDDSNKTSSITPLTQIVKPLPKPPAQDSPTDFSYKPSLSSFYSLEVTPSEGTAASGGRRASFETCPSSADHPLSMGVAEGNRKTKKKSGAGAGSSSNFGHHQPLSMKAKSAQHEHEHEQQLPQPPKLPPRRRGPDLSSLTVDDVSIKLKELGFSKKLVKKFHTSRIDGVLLEKLTEDTLKKEFGMSQVEFLLLDTFVTEGHIPQSGSPSGSLAKKGKSGLLK